jgi:uncharacterized protein (TIGR03437 family)
MMPKSLGGVQVSVNGSLVTLLYVSDSQVNAVAPLNLSGTTARIHVSFNGVDTADFVAAEVTAIPEIFQGVDGAAAAVNQDGSINSPEHPAPPGSIISIWATGISATAYGVWQDGRIATGAADFGCCQIIWAQGRPADVLYGGTAPGIVAGVAQVNFQVPVQVANPFLGYGPTLSVALGAGGMTSHPVQIFVAVPD